MPYVSVGFAHTKANTLDFIFTHNCPTERKSVPLNFSDHFFIQLAGWSALAASGLYRPRFHWGKARALRPGQVWMQYGWFPQKSSWYLTFLTVKPDHCSSGLTYAFNFLVKWWRNVKLRFGAVLTFTSAVVCMCAWGQNFRLKRSVFLLQLW